MFQNFVLAGVFYFVAQKFANSKKKTHINTDEQNPAVQWGPDGQQKTDFYIRDDQAQDEGVRFNEWNQQELRDTFGVVLGDVEAIYGPHVESTVKSTASEYLSPMFGKAHSTRPQVERGWYNVQEVSAKDQAAFLSNAVVNK